MLRSVQSNGFYTFSGREIAKLVGVSETAVFKRTKLRPEAPGYQRVADLYREGKTQVKIAQELNIAQTTVSQILQRKNMSATQNNEPHCINCIACEEQLYPYQEQTLCTHRCSFDGENLNFAVEKKIPCSRFTPTENN
jgi:DNA-binding XRE family transcriptional regulator